MKGATRASKVAAIAVLILAISIMGTSAAGGPPGGGFYSGQTIQNVGVGAATTTVTVYDSTNAANKYSKDYSISEGASQTFFLSDIPGVPSPFMGSAVVVSDQPVKAIVNVTNRKSGSNGVDGGTAAAQYRGVDDASTGTTVVFPLAKANFRGKTTAFYIQNAGSNAATFTATFLLGTSLTDTNPQTFTYISPSLAVGQMAVIVPSDAQGVGNELIGSLTVTSSEKLAGTVMEYETATAPAKILQGTSGFTSADFDTRVLFPVVKNRFGNPTRSTGLQVQNVGDTDVSVNMNYKGALGTCAGQTYSETARTLKPKQSTTYLESGIPAGCLASAEATVSSGSIAAVVNESFQPCSGCEQRATTYAAFPAKSATAKLVAPVFKEDLGGKRSGLTIQNVGNADTTATLVFKVGASTYTLQNLAIPMGSAATVLNLSDNAFGGTWAGGTALPNGSLAAVTVTAGQPIIGVVNEAPLPGTVQDNINYETFNVAP